MRHGLYVYVLLLMAGCSEPLDAADCVDACEPWCRQRQWCDGEPTAVQCVPECERLCHQIDVWGCVDEWVPYYDCAAIAQADCLDPQDACAEEYAPCVECASAARSE